MKQILALSVTLLLAVACVKDFDESMGNVPDTSSKIINTTSCATQGSLIVKLTNYADSYTPEVDGVAIETRALFPAATASADELHTNDMYRWWVLSFDESVQLDMVARAVANDSRVEFVEYDTIIESIGGDDVAMAQPAAKRATTRSNGVDYPFDDPLLEWQWHYYNDGQTINYGWDDGTNIEGADINLLSAWRYTAGDSRVIVAVLDGGVKCDHKDLVANMWVNEGEVAGDGIDNDGNGYVDDVHGYNFCANNANIQADDHGTHVAGTIAAVNNNGYLGCGIAGGTGNGDGCRIMSCQIFDGSGTASVSQIAAAIKYAADNGAVIMNNSWAYAKGSYTTDSSFKNQFSALINAIDYFEQNAKLEGVIDGGIALFAAGNDGYGVPSYPGAYYNNICVTSFCSNFTASSFTNYGAGANICAPGGENNVAGFGFDYGVISTVANSDEYGSLMGTSHSTPHVSGCAALGLSYALKLGKSYSAKEFKELLLTSVQDIDQYQVGTKSLVYPVATIDLSQYVGKLGSGYIDAHRLMMQVEDTPCLYVKTGSNAQLSLDEFFGEQSKDLTYQGVELSDAARTSLGITTTPTISNGVLNIKCTKSGVGRIKVTAIVGGSTVGGGNNMGGMLVEREVEIVARGSVATNGGWL